MYGLLPRAEDENFPPAAFMASLQPRFPADRRTLSRSYTHSLSSNLATLYVRGPVVMAGDADSRLRNAADAGENRGNTCDVRGVEQDKVR